MTPAGWPLKYTIMIFKKDTCKPPRERDIGSSLSEKEIHFANENVHHKQIAAHLLQDGLTSKYKVLERKLPESTMRLTS